jgi:hypothetical protein
MYRRLTDIEISFIHTQANTLTPVEIADHLIRDIKHIRTYMSLNGLVAVSDRKKSNHRVIELTADQKAYILSKYKNESIEAMANHLKITYYRVYKFLIVSRLDCKTLKPKKIERVDNVNVEYEPTAEAVLTKEIIPAEKLFPKKPPPPALYSNTDWSNYLMT